MTTSLYVQCVVMYILGQALHLFVIKIPSVKKRDKAANLDFSWGEYWAHEWSIIIGNQILGAMLVLGFDQLKNWKPEILDVVKWFFAAVGAIGSVAIMSKFSTYEKKVLKVIDLKTNEGDDAAEAKGEDVVRSVSEVHLPKKSDLKKEGE